MISPLKPIADFIDLTYFSGFPSGFKSHVLITSKQAGNCELLTIHNMNIFSRTRVYMTIFTFLRNVASFFMDTEVGYHKPGSVGYPLCLFLYSEHNLFPPCFCKVDIIPLCVFFTM